VRLVSAQNIVSPEWPLWLESAVVPMLQAHGLGHLEQMGSPSGIRSSGESGCPGTVSSLFWLVDSPEVGRGFEGKWKEL